MKLSLQLTAPLLLVASLTSPVLASSEPSRTIQIRNNDKVVLPPAGAWSKAGPLFKRNHSALRRAVPFGKVEAPLHVRAVVEERADDGEDVEFVDCSDYDPNESDDDDDDEESQGQVGTVAGGSASAPSSSSSSATWAPSPSASSDAPAQASPSPSSATISIDWSQFQNPKIVSPAEGALSLVTPQAAPQVSPGSSGTLKKEKTEVESAPAASADTKATANPDNIAPQTLTVEKGCIRYHTVVPGEVCLGVLDGSKDLGLTLDQFYAYNPVLDSTCSNLQVGWAVCTGKSS